MTDDILKEASQALREVTAEDHQGERFTRARVMASLHQSRQRSHTRLALLLPLAAILAGSTAWAGASGKLPEVWELVSDAVLEAVTDAPGGDEHSVSPPGVPGRRAPAAAPQEPDPEPLVAPDEEAEAEPGDEPMAPVRSVNAGGHGSGGVARNRRAAGDEAEARALSLYRAAHRAHFGGGDRATALRAWDAYLSAAPGGRFAVEARYNRALCLVGLGRGAEARAALEPFARGAHGGYRQQEATELLEALAGDAP